jgi:ABC-2 type transport system ATP-binding protein
VELGSPAELKARRMGGEVLEIVSSDAEGAMRALRGAQRAGVLELDEVALYGAAVHAVSHDAEQSKPVIASVLAGAGIAVHSMERIAPSLEDVFISSVKRRAERAQ